MVSACNKPKYLADLRFMARQLPERTKEALHVVCMICQHYKTVEEKKASNRIIWSRSESTHTITYTYLLRGLLIK